MILTGPTGSGKTELLDDVFGRGAPNFFPFGSSTEGYEYKSATVVSADSMQAYRGMDIGTAKPDSQLRARLPHELIDIKNPDEQYTAGEFVSRADEVCAFLGARAALPVISGGTGFYLKNFICGTPGAPPSDALIRAEVASDLERLGIRALREELEAKDPISAGRIHERDTYRLTRAVEILRASGKPPSFFAPSSIPRARYTFLIVGIERSRQELGERIRARVKTMFNLGLPQEIAALRSQGYNASSPAFRAIGYREFFELDDADNDRIAEAIALHSLQYAKRQMTFFRALPGIQWIQPQSEILRDIVKAFLST